MSQGGLNTIQVMSSNHNQYNSTNKLKFEKTVNLQTLSKNNIQLNDNGRYKKKPV